MALSEKIELLGKGLYTDIPNELTLKSIPTASELEYVGSEDFETTMVEKILPQAIEEQIDFKKLLEIDFYWICRCLRILNYGPYHTTNAIFCSKCGKTSYGEYSVSLMTVGCKPLPAGFVNDIVVTKDEFIEFDGDIHLKLPTIQDMLNVKKDKAFQSATGNPNLELGRLCYMIKSINGKSNLTPFEIKMMLLRDMCDADYRVLKDVVSDLTDYGLRAAGTCQCPNCLDTEAAYLALVNDKFFRPTLGDLRNWKHDRSSGTTQNLSASSTTAV